MRKLSSGVTTFTYKIFLPGVGTTILAAAGFSSSPAAGFVVAGVCIGLAILITARIKTVQLDHDMLVISGYFESIRVPLYQVASVSGSTVVSPDRVWITFAEPTLFGSEVVFLPVPRWLPSQSVHPIASELSSLCAQARAAHRP